MNVAASPSLQPAEDPDRQNTSPDSSAGPLCFVADDEASVCRFIALVMHGAGGDTVAFADRASLLQAIERQRPDIVFMNVALDANDAMDTLVALAKSESRPAIQLMSKRPAVLDRVKSFGEQKRLRMLAPLKKPLEASALHSVLESLKIGLPKPLAARIFLDDALRNDWIEYWLQPKIDLRRKRLVGVETFARARHPEFGVLMPSAFMPGALDDTIGALAEKTIVEAIRISEGLGSLGFNLPISVNIPIEPLSKLPLDELIEEHHANPMNWPGIIVDIPEDQIIHDIPTAIELSERLKPCNVRISIDDFAGGYSLLSRATELPFFEIKLSGEVTDCATNKTNASICKSVIDFAQRFGCFTTGTELQKASDVAMLVGMGCDFGQGSLMGPSMTEERFLMLLKQRTQAPATAPGTSAAA
jgi:EAL domain-containing protein (putative c-di-GMP-specific phosphodiesterase class I)